jgi:serine protease AprX
LGYNTFDDPSMNYSKAQMDGQTAVITRAANIAASKGIAIVVSAGNEGNNGWGIITSPADSEDVFTVGSIDINRNKAGSSSTGPTADGRIKPDAVSLGVSVSYVGQNGIISSGNGTSYASPLMASLVAGIWQRLPDLTAQQVLQRIRDNASQSSEPDNLLGYGIPNFIDVITKTDPEIAPSEMDVFPNPASSEINIKFANNSTNAVTIAVFDAQGKKSSVGVRMVSTDEFSINISHLKPGLYLVRCEQGTTLLTRKILKVD